jgi:hypothetical protein
MAVDANLVLQASVTKTDTFNSTGVNLPTGTPSRGLVARIIYSAATEASGGKTVIFSIDHSANNSTRYALASGAKDTITLSTTAQAGEISIPFRTNQPYVRLTMTLSANTNSPSITYFADVAPALPG